MRVITVAVAIMIISSILENFLPWWIIAPVACVVCYFFGLKWHQGFLAGFLGLFVMWAGMAFFLDRSNEHILSAKISMLIIKSAHPIVMVLITGLIGGLVAGFAGMTGALMVRK